MREFDTKGPTHQQAVALILSAVLLVALVLVPSPALARSIGWIDEFGSPAPELGTYGLDVFGGDVFTGGLTYGALPGQTTAGDADGWIRRTDGRGSEVWTTQFGTPMWEEVGAVRVDASGVYAVGATTGVFPGQTRTGGADGFLTRYDLDGNERWTVQFGTDRDDYAASVVADPTGIYVFGTTSGAFLGHRNRGRADVFVARFDRDGALEWLRELGSGRYEEAWALAVSPEGIYINGYTEGRLPGAHDRGGWDAFVGLYTRDGRRVWLRQFGSNRDDFGSGLAADARGVYVSGETQGALRGFANSGGADAFICRFSPTGSRIWTQQFGTEGNDGSAGAALVRNEVVVVGATAGAFPGQTNLGADDVFAMALDAKTGDSRWTMQFGTKKKEVVGWAWGHADDVFIIGETTGTFPRETNAGSFDSFLAQIDLG